MLMSFSTDGLFETAVVSYATRDAFACAGTLELLPLVDTGPATATSCDFHINLRKDERLSAIFSASRIPTPFLLQSNQAS